MTGALAGSIVAMIPAIHGTALGYYYDLPMSAWLWVAAAILLAVRRPIPGGLLAGGAFLLACLSKWTALILAPPLVLGVLVTAGEDRRRRLAAAGVAALTAAVGVALVLSVMSTSLRLQLRNSYGVESGDGAGFDLGGALATVLRAGGAPFGETLSFLSIRLVIGAVGPLFAAALLAAAGVWLWKSRVGGSLVLGVVVGDVLLIAWLFPALNDRWLISIVPALAIVAAIGLRELPLSPRRKNGVAAVVLGIGLLTTWDFHHGEAHARAAVALEREADWNQLRSWGAASSSEPPLGWARGDYLQDTFMENREWIWNAIIECGARDVLIEDPGVMDNEDDPWWQYRDILHRLDEGDPAHHIATLDGRQLTDEERRGDRAAVAILIADRAADAPTPAELVPGWILRRVVEGWADAPAVGFWTPPGSAVCGHRAGLDRD
jgi:hypothetical protein